MIYAYIAVMAVTTYLIRMLPLTLFQKKIRNRYIRSLYSSASVYSAAAGFLVAIVLSLREKSLLTVALSACGTVFVVERILELL